jgi:hypothetical protein
VILFKPEHVAPILAGRKVQTRRLGQKRWNVGAVHQARTRMLDAASMFARLRILAVVQEPLGWIDDYGAKLEGYESRGHYLQAWDRINGNTRLDTPVWVIEFEVVSREANTDGT